MRNLKDKLELLENEIASNEEAMKKRKTEELELRVAQLEMEREEANITSSGFMTILGSMMHSKL